MCAVEIIHLREAFGRQFEMVVRPADASATDLDDLRLVAAASKEEKCERCWHRRADVGANERHPTLCGRCVINVDGPGEERRFA